MSIKSFSTFVVALLAIVAFTVGCQKPDAGSAGTASHEGHDHDAEHDHAHDHPPHGPNHGHLFDLDSDDFKCEWCQYKDNNVIRFYLLDGKAKSPKPLVVEQFLVKPLVGSEAEPFELEPEDVDDDGAAHSFMLDEVLLRTAIPLGVEIEVITEDKTLKGTIKAHEPLDH